MIGVKNELVSVQFGDIKDRILKIDKGGKDVYFKFSGAGLPHMPSGK